MTGTGNDLLDRINRVIADHARKQHPALETITRKLRAIYEHIEGGGIPGPEEFRVLDFYDTVKILPKCIYISPLGGCRKGLSEYCPCRGEWEKGECSCRKYQPRE